MSVTNPLHNVSGFARGAFALAFYLLCSPILNAESLPGYVTYLLPIAANFVVPGAYGSRWQTETWVHNDATETLRIAACPSGIEPLPTCEKFYAPGTTSRAVDIIATAAHAQLLYVPVQDADSVTISHRLFELSRNAQPTGVQVPLVREDRFYTRSVRLIGLSTDSTARVALRVYTSKIYNSAGMVDAKFKVEFFTSNGTPLGETIVDAMSDGELPLALGFGMLGDVVGSFPQLAGVDRFDIRVSPLRADMPFWTMVTVTDRDTQHTLVVTAD